MTADGGVAAVTRYGVFAAVDDASDATLAALGALVAAHGDVALLQPDAPPQAPGVAVASQDLGVQMTAERLIEGGHPSPLGMLARGDIDAIRKERWQPGY